MRARRRQARSNRTRWVARLATAVSVRRRYTATRRSSAIGPDRSYGTTPRSTSDSTQTPQPPHRDDLGRRTRLAPSWCLGVRPCSQSNAAAAFSARKRATLPTNKLSASAPRCTSSPTSRSTCTSLVSSPTKEVTQPRKRRREGATSDAGQRGHLHPRFE
jgi:hypothetical protein